MNRDQTESRELAFCFKFGFFWGGDGGSGRGVSAQRNRSQRNCKSLRPWVPKKLTLVERRVGDLLGWEWGGLGDGRGLRAGKETQDSRIWVKSPNPSAAGEEPASLAE